jgi:hypothetical protein
VRLVVLDPVTLDGVMQGSGGRDEDTFWNSKGGGPFRDRLNAARAIVVSSSPATTGVILATYQPA